MRKNFIEGFGSIFFRLPSHVIAQIISSFVQYERSLAGIGINLDICSEAGSKKTREYILGYCLVIAVDISRETGIIFFCHSDLELLAGGSSGVSVVLCIYARIFGNLRESANSKRLIKPALVGDNRSSVGDIIFIARSWVGTGSLFTGSK